MTLKSRKPTGNITEFGAAFVVFICFFLIPFIDIGFLPVRYMFACNAVNELSYRLSNCRTRTDAYNAFQNDGWWRHTLGTLGISISDARVVLIACAKNGQTAKFNQGQTIPPEWLPNGKNQASVYSLEVDVKAAMAPIYGFKAALPAFDHPFPLALNCRSQWANLGLDSNTLEYCVNE